MPTPCLDDGLLQDLPGDCAAAVSDSATATATASDTDPISVDPTDGMDDDSVSGTMTSGSVTDTDTESDSEDGTESESDTETTDTDTSTDSDTDTDTDTGSTTPWCADEDGDGYGDPDACEDVPDGEDPPDDTVDNADDCDDTNENTFPGAAPNDDPTACMNDDDDDDWGDDDPGDGIDVGTDCLDDNENAFPGAAPNDDAVACMEDEDDDDYGDSDPPAGADPGTDCDDANTTTPAPNACLVWCLDADDDNYGDPDECVEAPDPPPGYVGNDSDCDDDNPFAFPGAAPNDDDMACMEDVDGDDWGDENPPAGVDAGTDCDDDSADIFPGSAPNDDPTACMKDEDGDDWGDDDPPAGVDPGTDCDDTSISTFPGAAPNDDPAACMKDDDDDDWGDENPPAGVDPGTDCRDDNEFAFPGAAPNDDPVACMEDVDGDDWGDWIPPINVATGTDCADDNANAFPGAAPNDHPNACMEDEDGDDWGDDDPPPGVTAGNDCDDTNPAVPVPVSGLPTTCADAELQEGSLGCEFIAAPLPHIDVGETIVFDVALSNPSTTQAATVNIERFVLGAWATVSGPHNVAAQSQTQVGLPLNSADTTGIYAGATYRVVSDIPIAVYQRSSQTFSTDASLLLPTNTWTSQYEVVGWDGLQAPADPGLEEYVAVIALADGTSVTVTPSRDTNGGGGVAAGMAGAPVNFMLDEGELAVVASQGDGGESPESLSGTHIVADGAIAVFTGTECSNIPSGVTACDHIEEQLLPLANVSQTYVASRVAVRNAADPEPVIWQIYAVRGRERRVRSPRRCDRPPRGPGPAHRRGAAAARRHGKHRAPRRLPHHRRRQHPGRAVSHRAKRRRGHRRSRDGAGPVVQPDGRGLRRRHVPRLRHAPLDRHPAGGRVGRPRRRPDPRCFLHPRRQRLGSRPRPGQRRHPPPVERRTVLRYQRRLQRLRQLQLQRRPENQRSHLLRALALEELLERGGLKGRIGAADDLEAGLRAAVGVAGEQGELVGELGEALRERVVHLLRVAAGEVDAAAALQEEGVAGHERAVLGVATSGEAEALRSGGVARRVEELDFDVPRFDAVVGLVLHEIRLRQARHERDPIRFRLVDVGFTRVALDERGEALDVVAHHVPTDVIGVIVGDERSDDLHIVRGGDLQDPGDIPRRVDHEALSRVRVAYEVDEVLHRGRDLVAGTEVPPSEELL